MSAFADKISEAAAAATAFLRSETTAVEFESVLIGLGFYNVEFNPPSASYLGVRYGLTMKGVKL